MHIRCPHCHNPIEVIDTDPLTDVSCPICGSNFSMISSETGSYAPGAIKAIGHFELLQKVGGGHFGTVWKARDTKLDRLVAVKIPRREQITGPEAEMFIREARVAAQVRHPGVVSVYEVGRENDTLYIVSDFIDGCSLKEWLSGRRLTPKEAAQLCVKIADALDAAHEAGVVHRDLKPGNVMMDMAGQPHLTDFGLAKREAGEITMTIDGQVLGTPAYMSPEQARGEAHNADRRSDVYSLGVILFELLTGEQPFRGSQRMMVMQILQDEPPSPRKLQTRIPRDLETICLKCLEKDRARRYATAGELAEDLKRSLDNKPIRARPASRLGKVWRWSKRQPVVALLTVTLAISLIVGTCVSTYFAVEAWSRAKAETILRCEAERQTRLAEALQLAGESREMLNDDVAHSLEKAVDAMKVTLQAGEAPPSAAEQAFRAAFAVAEEKTLRLVLHGTEKRPHSIISRDGRWLLTSSADRVDRLWDLTASDPAGNPLIVPAHEGGTVLLAITPNNRWIITEGPENVALFELTTSAPLARPIALRKGPGAVGGPSGTLTISTDGHWLVSSSLDGLRVWDLSAKDPSSSSTELHIQRRWSTGVAISPDSLWLAASVLPDGVCLWKLTPTGPDGSCIFLRSAYKQNLSRDTKPIFSPDGRMLAVCQDEGVCLWRTTPPDPTVGPIMLKPEGTQTDSLLFSPDSRWIVVGCHGALHLAATTPAARKLIALNGTGPVRFTKNGRWLIAADGSRRTRLWDLRTIEHGAEPVILPGTPGVLSADDHWLVTAAPANTAYLWDLTAEDPAAKPIIWRDMEDNVRFVVSPDSRWMASGKWSGNPGDKTARLWDLRACDSKTDPFTLRGHGGSIRGVEFSANSRWLVATDDWTAQVWDLHREDPSAPPVLLRGYERRLGTAAISADSHWFVTVGGNGVVVWDRTARSHQSLPPVLRGHTDAVTCVTFSENSRWLASGSRDRTVRLWDLNADDPARAPLVFDGHPAEIVAVAISPNFRWLATGSDSKTVRLWDLTSQSPTSNPFDLAGHAEAVYSMAISPDSHWLVTVSRDETALRWDLTASNPSITGIALRGLATDTPPRQTKANEHWLVGGDDWRSRLWNSQLKLLIAREQIGAAASMPSIGTKILNTLPPAELQKKEKVIRE